MGHAASGLSIVIPVFNEQEALPSLLNGLAREFPEGTPTTEILAVDDGSTDRTPEILRSHSIRVLTHPENLGYGKSLCDGIEAAIHETVVIMDGDGTYSPVDLRNLLGHAADYDMVVGARTVRESIFKAPLRRFFRWLTEFTVGRTVPDVNSGLRVFKRSRVMPIIQGGISQGFSFTTSLTLVYHLSGFTVKYVPISYLPRAGRRKVRMWRDSLRAMQIILETIAVWNPVKLFLLLSMIPLFGGLVLLTVSFIKFLPEAFVAGITLLGAAVGVFSLGFVGVILRRNSRVEPTARTS